MSVTCFKWFSNHPQSVFEPLSSTHLQSHCTATQYSYLFIFLLPSPSFHFCLSVSQFTISLSLCSQEALNAHTWKPYFLALFSFLISFAPVVSQQRQGRNREGQWYGSGMGFEGPQSGWSSPGGRGLKGTSCWGRRPSPSDQTGKCDIRGGSKGERQTEGIWHLSWVASFPETGIVSHFPSYPLPIQVLTTMLLWPSSLPHAGTMQPPTSASSLPQPLSRPPAHSSLGTF